MKGIEQDTPRKRLLRSETVREMVCRGRTRFSQLINDPEAGFPRPIKINGVSHGFFEDEVLAWLQKQPRVEPTKMAPATKFTGLADKGKAKRRALGKHFAGAGEAA